MSKLFNTIEKTAEKGIDIAKDVAPRIESNPRVQAMLETGAKIGESLRNVHLSEGLKDRFVNGVSTMAHKVDLGSVSKIMGGLALAGISPEAATAKAIIENKDVIKDVAEKSPLAKIGAKVGNFIKDGGKQAFDKIVEIDRKMIDKGVSLVDSVKDTDAVAIAGAAAGVGASIGKDVGLAASFASAGLDAARAATESVDCDGPEV